MNKYDNCVLLTRVGGFYELYFEHAEEYGPLLNLKVAQKKTGAGPVPMVIRAVPLFLASMLCSDISASDVFFARLAFPSFSLIVSSSFSCKISTAT